MTIYKYTLLDNTELFNGSKEVTISIPEGAWFLSVQEQKGAIVAWFAVSLEVACEQRRFYLVGTGFTLPKNKVFQEFLGTVQMFSQSLVVHVFRDVR